MSDPALHIVVATPCYGGTVTQRYMQSVCALLLATARENIALRVELLGRDSLITRARNSLVRTALDYPDCTHLMFIDADIGFSVVQFARMLRFDREVVAGMYPLKVLDQPDAVGRRLADGEAWETAQLRYVGAPMTGDGRREVDGFVTAEYAGTGFMLIKRSALERMIEAYPETRYTAAHDGSAAFASRYQYALFDCLIHPQTGEYLSEDYTFCHRWRAIGGDVWLDSRSTLAHVGAFEFLGDTGARFGHVADLATSRSQAAG